MALALLLARFCAASAPISSGAGQRPRRKPTVEAASSSRYAASSGSATTVPPTDPRTTAWAARSIMLAGRGMVGRGEGLRFARIVAQAQ
jgi:hypothetical protein